MNYETQGKFYWPSPEYSIPADNLCWHMPPAPNRDFRCVRPDGHPGKHLHVWSPTLKDHSHRNRAERRAADRIGRRINRKLDRAEADCQPCDGRGYFDSRHPGYQGHTTCSWCNGARRALPNGERA